MKTDKKEGTKVTINLTKPLEYKDIKNLKDLNIVKIGNLSKEFNDGKIQGKAKQHIPCYSSNLDYLQTEIRNINKHKQSNEQKIKVNNLILSSNYETNNHISTISTVNTIKKRKINSLTNLNDHNYNKKDDRPLIGHFIIDKPIGSGTFGEVRLGYHTLTKEKVAIKILEKRRLQVKEDVNRVKREMSILTKLNHQNLVQTFEILEDEKNFYIIMELIKGGELFNLIVTNRKLDEREAAFFFYQLLNGLEEIHRLDIAHRDLKPENLIFTNNKILKIIDFGLSNNCKDLQRLETPCGSPCYASPEMILGDDYEGKTIDLWSVGIVLYAMVCGFLPFEEKSNDLLFKKICECKLVFPDYVTENSRDMIRLFLNVDPNKRVRISQVKSHPFYLLGQKLYELHIENFYNQILKNLNFHFYQNLEEKNLRKKFSDLFNCEIEEFSYQTVEKATLKYLKNYLNMSKDQVETSLNNNQRDKYSTSFHLLFNKRFQDKFLLEDLLKKEVESITYENDKNKKLQININVSNRVNTINLNIEPSNQSLNVGTINYLVNGNVNNYRETTLENETNLDSRLHSRNDTIQSNYQGNQKIIIKEEKPKPKSNKPVSSKVPISCTNFNKFNDESLKKLISNLGLSDKKKNPQKQLQNNNIKDIKKETNLKDVKHLVEKTEINLIENKKIMSNNFNNQLYLKLDSLINPTKKIQNHQTIINVVKDKIEKTKEETLISIPNQIDTEYEKKNSKIGNLFSLKNLSMNKQIPIKKPQQNINFSHDFNLMNFKNSNIGLGQVPLYHNNHNTINIDYNKENRDMDEYKDFDLNNNLQINLNSKPDSKKNTINTSLNDYQKPKHISQISVIDYISSPLNTIGNSFVQSAPKSKSGNNKLQNHIEKEDAKNQNKSIFTNYLSTESRYNTKAHFKSISSCNPNKTQNTFSAEYFNNLNKKQQNNILDSSNKQQQILKPANNIFQKYSTKNNFDSLFDKKKKPLSNNLNSLDLKSKLTRSIFTQFEAVLKKTNKK